MAHHILKSWPSFFAAIVDGSKKHDLRDDSDRNFKTGDTILLREYCPFGGGYSGRCQLVKITYITSRDIPCAFSSAVLPRNYVILSFELLGTMGGTGFKTEPVVVLAPRASATAPQFMTAPEVARVVRTAVEQEVGRQVRRRARPLS